MQQSWVVWHEIPTFGGKDLVKIPPFPARYSHGIGADAEGTLALLKLREEFMRTSGLLGVAE